MKQVREYRNYERDLKQLKKRGKDLSKLKKIISLLVNSAELPHNARPHKLKGEYEGLWECHIEPDWVLIYNTEEDILHLARTGRHQDLFEKY